MHLVVLAKPYSFTLFSVLCNSAPINYPVCVSDVEPNFSQFIEDFNTVEQDAKKH